MPDDRLFHKRLGHSQKVNLLTEAEEIVWRTYIQAADDFGVMRFAAISLQDTHDRLAKRPTGTVQRWLEHVRDVGLIYVFEHQDREYCYQPDWQDYQKVRYPLRTVHPKIPDDLLEHCSRATRWLFTAWPGSKVKLATWQPPASFEPSGNDSGNSSGNPSGNLSGKPSGNLSRRSRASAPAGGVFPDPLPLIPIPSPVPDVASSTPCVESEGIGVIATTERSVASPQLSSARRSLLTPPNSTQPAHDGNYAVIVKIAHEVLGDLGSPEPTAEACERVKELCASRRIDYGRDPAVGLDVVRRAVESAAAQRVLIPAQSPRGRGPTSLGTIADEFRARLEAMRPAAKEA